MPDIRIACAAVSGRIYAGRINAAGTEFSGPRRDVTSDVLRAVVDHVGLGNVAVVTVGGVPRYEIEVTGIAAQHPQGNNQERMED